MTNLAGGLFRPKIVSLSRSSFRCGNGIPVSPELTVDDKSNAEIVVIPELWLAPDDDLKGPLPGAEEVAPPAPPRGQYDLFRVFRRGAAGCSRPAQQQVSDVSLGLCGFQRRHRVRPFQSISRFPRYVCSYSKSGDKADICDTSHLGQLKFGRLQHRKIGALFTHQNLAGQSPALPV